MQNFFGINVKTQEKTYSPFITRSVSKEVSLKQDEAEQRLYGAEKATQLPPWLKIIQLICLFVAVCTLCGALKAIGEAIGNEEPFAQAWARFVENGIIWIIAAGLICLAIFGALQIRSFLLKKNVARSPAFNEVLKENEKIQKRSYEELGVPEDADAIDVLTHPFKINKKGKILNGNPLAKHININLKIFKYNDCLFFADTSDLIKIPLSSVITATAVNKRVNFYGWNKEKPYNAQEFKPYKIMANNMGTMVIKGYYSITVLSDGEEREIIIPAYEKDILIKYVTVI